ncbi:transmembrane protein 51b [Gasterosteus aculeatus]|uniref:Transmembrane protein 51b n=1 Tax=Gasterosteus aculeatus aculeatus TaxID=481459 RepID=G3N8E7_GASAC|nr:transmembrane protein 51b [Gasterosteus aculeatus aculeatus]XP_040060908.1 transmembrane protein 51b [Gasterosteus aculeatus aculeatus]XP_040060909.1 transmembrane protein 51b [Gasterosteus aculeatus aculeatus]
MCSSRSLCGNTSRSSGSEGTGSGAHYALCALGVGLIALGIVMIVWTVVPMDGEDSGATPTPPSNSTAGPDAKDSSQPSTVAMVLVGVGVAVLLLSILLCVRSRKKRGNATSQPAATADALLNHVAREPEEAAADRASYTVPSYEEVVTSGAYPVRQSNLRNSTSQLPSYEDIIAAVENEGTGPADGASEVTPLGEAAPGPAVPGPAAEPRNARPGLSSNHSLLTRSASRASRLLRPLRVRRIKSDKLHLKDFRLQIRSPTQNPVTIEPITPPPLYDNKMPELE